MRWLWILKEDYGRNHLKNPIITWSAPIGETIGEISGGKGGGDGGIRTHDGLLAHTPLAGEHLRPLGHVSA